MCLRAPMVSPTDAPESRCCHSPARFPPAPSASPKGEASFRALICHPRPSPGVMERGSVAFHRFNAPGLHEKASPPLVTASAMAPLSVRAGILARTPISALRRAPATQNNRFSTSRNAVSTLRNRISRLRDGVFVCRNDAFKGRNDLSTSRNAVSTFRTRISGSSLSVSADWCLARSGYLHLHGG
jgi:hypothetical protein